MVKKVTATALHFQCPACERVAEVPFDQMRVYAREGIAALVLPKCACGAQSETAPSAESELPGHHLRRIAWRRAVAAANWFDAESAACAAAQVARHVAFYAGRAAMRAEYENDASVVEMREGVGA